MANISCMFINNKILCIFIIIYKAIRPPLPSFETAMNHQNKYKSFKLDKPAFNILVI